jgi:hypothetical protein
LSNEIKNVLRQLSEYELFYPCINRDQTVLHEFWERINGINFLDVFTQEELNHWHDEAIEDSFNEAVAYLNAHPEKTAAGKFFSLYPECRGNPIKLPFSRIDELVARTDRLELETGRCR